MQVQHKGRVTDTGKHNGTGMVFMKLTSAPGVNFRTDFMSKEEIEEESGPCVVIVPKKEGDKND
jgi:hypothetical protein